MKARLIQLLTRYLAVAMLAVVGFIIGDEQTAQTVSAVNDIAAALAVALVAFVLLLWDLVSHKIQNGWLIKKDK